MTPQRRSGGLLLVTTLAIAVGLTVSAAAAVSPTADGDHASAQVATSEDTAFVVESATRNAEFDYRFTVDGDVAKAAIGGRTAESADRVTDNGDGTVTVSGFAGDLHGDAYRIDGVIVAFEKTGGNSRVRLEREGEDVTADLTGSDAPDGARYGTAPIAVDDGAFVVESTTADAESDYRFTVDGRVSRATVGERAAESADRIRRNDDGTVTVTGFAGDLHGDGFRVDGELLSFEQTGGDSGLRLELNGADVTDALTASDGSVDPPADSDLRTISYGETAQGTIGPSDPAGGEIPNYYEPVTFSGDRGDVITVDVVSAEVPAYLMLVAPNGSTVARAGYEGDPSPQITAHTLTRSGAYTVRVYGDDNMQLHDYTLSLERVGRATPGEPNDDFDAATDLPPGSYDGLPHTRGESDFYAVDIADGQVINAWIQSPGQFPNMVLYDPDRDVVERTMRSQGDNWISTPPLDGGTYYLEVTAAGPSTSYSLDLGTTPDDDRFEPNNDRATATELTPGRYEGLRITDGETDAFAVDVTEGQQVAVAVEFDHGTGDLDLGYRFDADYVGSFSDTDDESFTFEAREDGPFVFEVLGSGGASAPYSLSVRVDGESAGVGGDGRAFVVESASPDEQFNYTFTVDGDVSRASVGEREAERSDRIVDNGDGTVTVVGYAGGLYGDAYTIDGEIRSFERIGGQSAYRLELDGADVTAELTGSDSPDGAQFGEAPIAVDEGAFVVESTSRNAEFNYTFTVEGDVSRASVGEREAEQSDRIVDNGDGTVTVVGYAGGLYGDGFVVDGRLRSFEKTGGQSGYRLELNGENVTAQLTG